MPNRSATSVWVIPLDTMYWRRSFISSARILRIAASAGSKPRSAKERDLLPQHQLSKHIGLDGKRNNLAVIIGGDRGGMTGYVGKPFEMDLASAGVGTGEDAGRGV